jgi:hypothetical protein
MMASLRFLGLKMADTEIPDKLLPAVRVAVFWVGLPFIGLLLGGEDIRGGNYYWATAWFGCALLSIAVAVYWGRFVAVVKSIIPCARQWPIPTLLTGLYVSDIRLTFANLVAERHSEISMRVFNGTGRVVKFSGLSGHIKFTSPNSANPSHMGDLPTPSTRADMAQIVEPFKEWLVILSQRVPATEADKLLALLAADIPIHFDLSGLTIEICAQDNQQQVERLPIWGGVSYNRGNGFDQIIYGTAHIKL